MKLFKVLLLLHSLFFYSNCYINATESNDWKKLFSPRHYQDIIINNKIVSRGIRSCFPTWKLIEPIVAKYSRPITVLDLGAAHGYFSIKIASQYPCTCVMVEDGIHYPKHAKELLTICKKNTSLSNIIFLNQTLTPKKLYQIGRASCRERV